MDCKELYAQKLMTAAQAAALVKSGDWVDYGWAVNTPVAVDAELAKRLPELEGVNFRGGILMWVPEIFQIDDPAAHMTWNSWHMGGIERKAIAQGFSFYSPIRYSELPRYYRESPDPLDIAVFQVTPMDAPPLLRPVGRTKNHSRPLRPFTLFYTPTAPFPNR